jgi:hypothetical protein
MSNDNQRDDDDLPEGFSEESLMGVLAAALSLGGSCPHEHQLGFVMQVMGALVHAAGGKIEVDMSVLKAELLKDKGLGIYAHPEKADVVVLELEMLDHNDQPVDKEPVFVHAPSREMH